MEQQTYWAVRVFVNNILHLTPKENEILENYYQTHDNHKRSYILLRELSPYHLFEFKIGNDRNDCSIENTRNSEEQYKLVQVSELSSSEPPTLQIPPQLTIATLNVHGWKTENFENNCALLASLIREYEFDIVSLNEVWVGSKLNIFANYCGFKYYLFGSAWGDFGNCILSRHEIQSATNVNSKRLESRSFLTVKLSMLPDVSFSSTHLDHMTELTRLYQLDLFLKHGLTATDSDHFVLGDFNALTRQDYSPQLLQEITMVRKQNQWERPQFGVSEFMKDNGFSDLSQMNSSFTTTTTDEENNVDDEYIETCRYGTRIDYIYHKRSSTSKYVQGSKLITDNVRPYTDHNLVHVKLTLSAIE